MIITEEYIKSEIMEYNFIKNTVKSFALKYSVSERYVHKKIREWNIKYNKRVVVKREKDKLGRFTFKNTDNKLILNKNNNNKNEKQLPKTNVKEIFDNPNKLWGYNE